MQNLKIVEEVRDRIRRGQLEQMDLDEESPGAARGGHFKGGSPPGGQYESIWGNDMQGQRSYKRKREETEGIWSQEKAVDQDSGVKHAE